MRTALTRALLLAAAIGGLATPASAICMVGIPLCQSVWESASIFEGTVVSIEQRDPPEAKNGGTADPARLFDVMRAPHKIVTFEIIRSWRGNRGPRVQLVIPGGPGLWVEDTAEFARNRRYVVFASRVKDGNYLTASSCGPTAPVPSKAASEAVAFLDTLSQPSSG